MPKLGLDTLETHLDFRGGSDEPPPGALTVHDPSAMKEPLSEERDPDSEPSIPLLRGNPHEAAQYSGYVAAG